MYAFNPPLIPPNRKKVIKKHKFSDEDDLKLIGLVKKHGSHSWSLISKEFEGRNARQCRDRWKHYLDPETDHSDWKEEEDELLKKLYAKYGNKWSLIATNFPKRTNVSVRNRCWKLFHLNNSNHYSNFPYLTYNPYIIQNLPNNKYFTGYNNKSSVISGFQEILNIPQALQTNEFSFPYSYIDYTPTIKRNSKSSRTLLPSIDSFPFPF